MSLMKDEISLKLSRASVQEFRDSLVKSLDNKTEQRDGLDADIAALEAEIGLIDEQLKQSGPKGASGKVRRKRSTKEDTIKIIQGILGISGVAGLTLNQICIKGGIAWSSAYRAVKGNPLFEQKDGKWTVKRAYPGIPPPRRSPPPRPENV